MENVHGFRAVYAEVLNMWKQSIPRIKTLWYTRISGMAKTKLLIIADDFTGGLDTGVQFAKLGISVQIVMDGLEETRWTDSAAVILVVVTETRHMSPKDAYDTVLRIVSQGVAAGIPHVYKKTDSALRGNPGAELAAALHAGEGEMLSFIPAYPAMNRITVDGIHYIDGIPVSESAFGKDPLNPVTSSDVLEVLSSQTETPLYNTDPDHIRSIEGILVINAKSDQDMKHAGERLKEIGALKIMAGCAGFASILPELLDLHQTGRTALPQLGNSLTVICGSINPITLRQLDHAEKHGFCRVHLPAGHSPELTLPQSEKWLLIDDPAGIYAGTETERQVYLARLADVFGKLIMSREGIVLLTGGDTLMACLRHIGVRRIVPLLELFPGVVLSRIQTAGNERLIISKSGGFGDETLITDLRKIMTEG